MPGNIFKSASIVFRGWNMNNVGAGTGLFYIAGHYNFPTTDANLTEIGATVNIGTANEASGIHASLVAGGAGVAAGGAGAVEIEVSGTSINELGVRTAADTEIIVADITAMALDQYFETTKKWLGQITFTLQNASGSTQTTFSADFNYGQTKYTDMGDRNFKIKELKVDGLAGANDAGFDIRLLQHSGTGWTYAATGFVPGNGEVVQLSDDYAAERQLINGENFAYDRVGLNTFIKGSLKEGYIIEITTTANNALRYFNASVVQEVSF